MASLNKISLIGYLGRDVETKYLESGSQVANFSVAVTEKWKEKETTEWFNVVAFGKLAEICSKYLTKGSLVYVEGKIRTRTWDDKDGNKKSKTEVLSNQMQILKGGSKGTAGTGSEDNDAPPVAGEDEVPF
jgi:single-strand DNA-binding protein